MPKKTPLTVDHLWQILRPGVPSLSPDGATVAFARRAGGSWGIYAQRVGGRNATVLIDEPDRDESGPAFSPDGARIAFHESDDDGGIFVAGATGESVRRVTDIGFHPAWSPDGTQIAFTSARSGGGAGQIFLAQWHHEAALAAIKAAPLRKP